MKEKKIISLPPNYFYAGIIFIIVVYFCFPSLQIIRFPYNLFGLIPSLAGFSLVIWPAYVFRKHNTPENFDPATCLVYGGVYCYSRNPMYLGGVICLAGLALCSGNLLSFISPLVFFVFMQWMFIPHEEARLTEIFGKEYQEYKARVRRWL